MKVISTKKAPAAIGPYSQAIQPLGRDYRPAADFHGRDRREFRTGHLRLHHRCHRLAER